MHLLITLLLAGLASALPGISNNSSIAERQSCFPAGDCTKIEGDGDPHQKYLHKQLSAPVDCGTGSCTVGFSEQQSYTIEASVSEGIEWIDAGFAVSESFETGTYEECTGDAGDTICVWEKIAHTAYTVRPGEANSCDQDGCQEFDWTTAITSPNNNNAGGKFYCMRVHTCGAQGDEWWEDGAPGGPPS